MIIMEGPDRCGKTNIGKDLARTRGLSYFKVSSETENWRTGGFLNALRFDQTYVCEFLEQTGFKGFVADRMYPSELVYASVYGRETDMNLCWELDRRFAELGAIIVICTAKFPPPDWDDELVDVEKFDSLVSGYDQFFRLTSCRAILLDVDRYGRDIDKQRGPLNSAINHLKGPTKGLKVIL